MHAYLGALSVLVAALAAIGLLQLAHRATSGRAAAPTAVLTGPFLSGWEPAEHALSRLHARWYPLTLLFLAFDVEMLFMYPWTLVVAQVGASAVVEMFVFLGALLLAVAWAWREGVLRWV